MFERKLVEELKKNESIQIDMKKVKKLMSIEN
jgi:hypothetical protein